MENREQETGNQKPANARDSLSLRESVEEHSRLACSWAILPLLTLALVVRGISVAAAETVDLGDFLHGAEAAAQVTVPLRAEGQFEVASPEATRHDEIALMMRPPTDTFIELHREGVKVVLLGDGAFRVKGRASKAESFPPDASLDDSDFTREDLEPFRVSHYKDARISDDSATQLTVTLFPTDSQYSLVVITFDRQKRVPLKILYYRDTVSNLVKMQRDSDYVLVGDKWKPTTISMETFKLRTHSAMNVRWMPQSNLPAGLFDPASLTQSSLTLWPTAPAKP
jgi:hypothetical protein